jgi:hypothetical protein
LARRGKGEEGWSRSCQRWIKGIAKTREADGKSAGGAIMEVAETAAATKTTAATKTSTSSGMKGARG